MGNNLKNQGFRFIFRAGTWDWRHPLEVQPQDVDCTDMNDEQFEAFYRSVA